MKKIGYFIFGFLFHFYRIFPVKKKKVVLFMGHDCKFQGNIRYVYEELKKRQEGYTFVIRSKKKMYQTLGGKLQFFLSLSFHMATAEAIFLNDNFLPLAYTNPSKKTKIVQLWHGVGAFKRFGLSTDHDPIVRECVTKGNKRLTHLFVSSPAVVPYYEEALGVDQEKIFATGVALTDFYFDEEKKQEARAAVYEKYPQWRGKKVLLYTPTFRETKEQNANIMKQFDMKEVSEALGDEWVVLIRLHPQVRDAMPPLVKNCYDVTEYPDIKGLFMVSDALVADYSSTVVEYVLLDKPILLYAYDLEMYDRGFYDPYRELAPGELLCTKEEFLSYLTKCPTKAHYAKFIEREYGTITDGKATKRVVDMVFSEK